MGKGSANCCRVKEKSESSGLLTTQDLGVESLERRACSMPQHVPEQVFCICHSLCRGHVQGPVAEQQAPRDRCAPLPLVLEGSAAFSWINKIPSLLTSGEP